MSSIPSSSIASLLLLLVAYLSLNCIHHAAVQATPQQLGGGGRLPKGFPAAAANGTANNGAKMPNIQPLAPIDPLTPGAKGNNSANAAPLPPSNATAPAKAPAATDGPRLSSGCVRTCRRKEIRQLTPAEKDAFIRAVRALQSGPAPTEYDRFVKKHMDAEKFAHGNAHFLPWHRAFLLEFEQALQRVDPSICLPYWNWSLDSQAPELAIVFQEGWFGGNGQGNDNCVGQGPFANWRPYYPRPHCLRRRFDGENRISAFHSVEAVNRVIASNRDYETFRRAVETGLHPGTHLRIGGDMREMYSPNDPIFFLHHGFIEFLWTTHQKMHGFGFGGNGMDGQRVRPSDVLAHLDTQMTVDQVMDTRALCYDYVELAPEELEPVELTKPVRADRPPRSNGQHPPAVSITEIPPPSNTVAGSEALDRTLLNALRVPPPADEDWLVMNHGDVQATRQFEDEYRQVYQRLRNIKGYISPCSLWKRPTLFAEQMRRSPNADVAVDVPNVGRVTIKSEELAKEKPNIDPVELITEIKVVCVEVAPEVELPVEAYSKEVKEVVGQQAFEGAGSLSNLFGLLEDSAFSLSASTGLSLALTLLSSLVLTQGGLGLF